MVKPAVPPAGALAGRPETDPARIFALTNSEGCVYALNYQIQPTGRPFAGMILTSAFARAAGVLARSQIAVQLAAYDAAIADFLTSQPVQLD